MIDTSLDLVLDLAPKVPIVKGEVAITITEEDRGLALAPHHTDEGIKKFFFIFFIVPPNFFHSDSVISIVGGLGHLSTITEGGVRPVVIGVAAGGVPDLHRKDTVELNKKGPVATTADVKASQKMW